MGLPSAGSSAPADAAALGLSALAEVLTRTEDGICVVDAERRYVYANPAACQMLGLPVEELRGRDFLGSFPAWEHASVLTSSREARRYLLEYTRRLLVTYDRGLGRRPDISPDGDDDGTADVTVEVLDDDEERRDMRPSLAPTTRASSTPTSAATLRAHRTVTKAIQAQDPEAAGRRMSRHVYSYAEAVTAVEDRTSIEIPEN